MTVLVFDCVDIWLCWYLTVLMLDCLDIWFFIFDCLDIWLCWLLTFLTFDCLDIWLSRYLTVLIFDCLDTTSQNQATSPVWVIETSKKVHFLLIASTCILCKLERHYLSHKIVTFEGRRGRCADNAMLRYSSILREHHHYKIEELISPSLYSTCVSFVL